MATPATGAFSGTPASIIDSDPPQATKKTCRIEAASSFDSASTTPLSKDSGKSMGSPFI